MRFFSEYTKKFYDTAEKCQEDETIFLKQEAEKKKTQEEKTKRIEALRAQEEVAAKKVEVALNEYEKIHKELSDLLYDNNKVFFHVPTDVKDLNELFKFFL